MRVLPYRPRDYGIRKDWKTSIWYYEYVLDVDNKYQNPNSRNGKLFRYRFSLDFEHITHIADEMIASGVYTERRDAYYHDPIINSLFITNINQKLYVR